MQNIFVFLSALFLIFLDTVAFAGECKVRYPAPSVRRNAMEFTSVAYNTYRHGLFSPRFKRKTGHDLELLLVARAGQSPDKALLINQWINGQARSLAQLVSEASSKNPNITGPYVRHYLEKNYLAPEHDGRMIYSHIGITYDDHGSCWEHSNKKTEAELRASGWCFKHELRPCVDEDAPNEFDNYSQPYTWDQSPPQFFADDPYELRALLAIPKIELQKRLKVIMKNGQQIAALTGSTYNVLAKWDHSSISQSWQAAIREKMANKTDEQNSNGWVLEMVAAAVQPEVAPEFGPFGTKLNRAQIVEVLKRSNYQPSIMVLDSIGYQVFGSSGDNDLGRWAIPMIRIDPKEQPYIKDVNAAEVVTVNSIIDWMHRNGWLETLTYYGKEQWAFDIEMNPKVDYREDPRYKALDVKFKDVLKDCRAEATEKLGNAVSSERKEAISNCIVREFGENATHQ